ncbi:hypothetical protein ACFX15_024329 [Malus domestica]
MADYGRADEAEDSNPSETIYCKFRRRIGLSPNGSSATEQSPPHLDLAFLICCCFPFLGLDFDVDKWISYDHC